MLHNIIFITKDLKNVFNPIKNADTLNLQIELKNYFYISDDFDSFLKENSIDINSKTIYEEHNDEIFLVILSDMPLSTILNETAEEYLFKNNNAQNPHFKIIDRMIKESTLIKPQNYNGLNKLTIEKIEKERSFLEKIKKSDDKDEKIRRLELLASRQQDLLDSLIKDEDTYLSLISQFNNYRSLALRGLSFMAGGHEMSSIFNSLKYFIKTNQNNAEIKTYLKDFNRLEEIFKGQVAINGNPDFHDSKIFNGKSILNYCSDTFGQNKKLTFDQDIQKYSSLFPVNQTGGLTIISNLIRNALSFSKTKIEVKWINDLIIVSDDGLGVDKDDINKLFKTGFSKRRNGHGLGLFLCKEKALELKCNLYLDPDNKYTELTGASFIFDLKGKYNFE